MSLKVKKTKDVCHVTIDDEMTIYSASTLKKDLLNEVAANQNVEISLENVTEIDSAGLQIMIMLREFANQEHKDLHFIHHSPEVVDVMELVNLTTYFGDPIVMQAEE